MKKLVVVLIAVTLATFNGLSSMCMAVRDNREAINVFVDQVKTSQSFALTMLNSIDKSVGLKSSDHDGNYFKMDKLSGEEKKTYDEVVAQVREIKNSVNKDSSSDLKKDCKLAKAIFFWVRNNITYDKASAEGSVDENSFEGKLGIKSVYKNRKPQDALTTFKNKTGVCVGFERLAQLMMKIAGLPCLFVGNHDHEFGAVWLDSLNGWALFDATCTEELKQQEKQASEKAGVSPEVIALDDNFTAVSDPGKHTLQEDNKYFIAQGLGDHFVYNIGDQMTGFFKMSLDFDGVSYIPFPAMLMVNSNNKSISVDDNWLSMNRKCKIEGNVENIQNFDVFAKKFVKVDASKSHLKKTLKKDGFEFNLFCDGDKSKLEIKPSDSSVSCEEVELPDELIPFLADIDIFDVAPNVKTVKYDLLRTVDNLKKDVTIPSNVDFRRIEKIDTDKAEFIWDDVWGKSNSTITISLKDGANIEEVEIPEKLGVFLPHVNKFVVNSDKIKTVKYSLLNESEKLKDDVIIPNEIKFEQINS